MQLARGEICLVTLLLLAICLPVQGAEWYVSPKAALRSGFNDNIRLETSPHDSVWETVLTPSAKLGVAMPNQSISTTASVAIRRFTGGSGRNSGSFLDREDYKLLTRAYRRDERNAYSADLKFISDNTLDSALDLTGQVISQRATRRSITFSPAWKHSLNEKNLLDLSYRFSKVDYSDETSTSGLVAYDFNALNALLTHQFTPRLQGTLSSSYSIYQPESGSESNTLNLQAGLTREFSETLSGSFLVGTRNTTSDASIPVGYCIGANPGAQFPACTGGAPIATGFIGSLENTGTVFSATLAKKLETGELAANLSRATNPSLNGGLLDTTNLSITLTHKFSETLQSDVTMELYNTETIANTSGNNIITDENFLRFRPRLTWRWLREWSLSADYEYVENENNQTATARTATRNAFYLRLNYQPIKWSISR
jgi:hypothetical protein